MILKPSSKTEAVILEPSSKTAAVILKPSSKTAVVILKPSSKKAAVILKPSSKMAAVISPQSGITFPISKYKLTVSINVTAVKLYEIKVIRELCHVSGLP